MYCRESRAEALCTALLKLICLLPYIHGSYPKILVLSSTYPLYNAWGKVPPCTVHTALTAHITYNLVYKSPTLYSPHRSVARNFGRGILHKYKQELKKKKHWLGKRMEIEELVKKVTWRARKKREKWLQHHELRIHIQLPITITLN